MSRRKVYLFPVFFSTFYILHSIFLQTAYAVCPVCTVAVGAGLGLSRYFGIDDAVSSIWIGGLILSSSFWLIDWVEKKKFKALKLFNRLTISIAFISLMYALVLIPLWYGKIIGHPFNTILGIDKILFGTAIGSLAFLHGIYTDKKIRQIRGKQLFQFQKVVFPVVSLVFVSLLTYYYGGYLY